MLLFLVSLALQQPQVVVQTDRNEVFVGGTVSVTIIVTASGADRVVIDDPDLRGLELLDHRQQTRVSLQDGVPRRVTTRELSLRAVQAGTARVGAVRVRQGDSVVETSPMEILVRSPEVSATSVLSPRVQPLINRARPANLPPNDVVLTIERSSESVLVGEQLDIVVVAWFPRDIRTQLRNPPTLESPEVRGAWVYSRPAPAGVALSRNVGGRWYDLFVLHEVAFPLTAGTMEIGAASVSYSVPLSGSFLSRELRREARSERMTVAVGPLPTTRQGSGFSGAVGRDLEIRLDVSARELRQGDAARVRVEILGIGNVSLWPEPRLEWPSGVKAYQQEVTVSITPRDGLVGGSKAYEYLVVVDSVGTHSVPDIRYTYYDTGERRYVPTSSAGIAFLAPGDARMASPLRAAQPLMLGSGRSVPDWLLGQGPVWLWMLLVLLPPLSVLAGPMRRRLFFRLPHGLSTRRAVGSSPLVVLDAEFNGVLERLVPGAESKAGLDVADALRAAGVDSSLASHASRIRDRLRHALYGPDGSPDADELAAEVQEVLGALAGDRDDRVPANIGTALALLLAVCWAPTVGQTPRQLYEAGAIRVAADSFAARAAAEPYVAAHWLNLGNSFERMGEGARARVAWLRAVRLAPRNSSVQRSLERAPLPDTPSDQLAWVSPITPGEALLGSAFCWVVAWILAAMHRRRRWIALLLTLAVMLGAFGGYVSARYAQPVALILHAGTPLRSAPYGTARAPSELEEASAVLIERTWGSWRLVSHGAFMGWILSSEMIEL